MTNRYCILVCKNFLQELEKAVAVECLQNVSVIAFPSRCGRPPVTWDEIADLLPEACTQLVIIGRACLKNLDEPPTGFVPTRIIHLEECFHLVAGPHLVAEIITDGGYLITPAWLADWRRNLEELGFYGEQSKTLFKDFATELVLLDTGIDPGAKAHLSDLGEMLELPVKRVAVGLDYTRAFLKRMVLEWQLENERSFSHKKDSQRVEEQADLQVAMDMLSSLAKVESESKVIANIEELFQMLFSPEVIYFHRIEDGVETPVKKCQANLCDQLRSLDKKYSWTKDGKGFLLSIENHNVQVGKIAVHQLAFPGFRERYLNMALSMIGVCALAIENARNRKKLTEAEKMAALSIVVAGIAHEINTPLGVCLASVSLLQGQSRNLSGRFAQRSMTQKNLESYLESTEEETKLVLSNLERIGQLTKAFRQVAVDEEQPEKQRFQLQDCFNDTISSLGSLLPAERIEVRFVGDEALGIESQYNDWVTVFINLVTNSVKHGFPGQSKGTIEISGYFDNGYLNLHYHDSGQGIEPETIVHMFDPFYTTDMQHGLGLGMHLVYNLITQRLGGSIQCQSSPGEGASFYIKVPV